MVILHDQLTATITKGTEPSLLVVSDALVFVKLPENDCEATTIGLVGAGVKVLGLSFSVSWSLCWNSCLGNRSCKSRSAASTRKVRTAGFLILLGAQALASLFHLPKRASPGPRSCRRCLPAAPSPSVLILLTGFASSLCSPFVWSLCCLISMSCVLHPSGEFR